MLRGIVAVLLAAPAFLSAAPAKVDFGRDILPILSDNCFHCHGPDEKSRKAKLRLDTKEGALRLQDPVILPGKANQSEFMKRITTRDADDLMPPADSKRKLTSAQIALFKRWVDEGALWGKHWAFEPPRRPELPKVKDVKWPRGDLDRFILARLEKESLKPAPEAPRETLIRRVTLDLTGLPPTPAEVSAFLADKSTNAYERVVDRLFASPRYGERMVWEWLDAARYADSNGYQGDGTRTMWPWRDWAVNALNANMPFDRFTIEQLAGDLLPNATRDQRIATAFNRNHMINGEGGRIAEENRIEYLFDQAETLSTVWLGLTLGCARCHDHKFDPFSQRDYYSLLAFFNNTPVNGGGGNGQTAPVIDFSTPEQVEKLAGHREEVRGIGAKIDELEKTLFPREEKKLPADSPAAKEFSGNVLAELKRAAAQRGLPGLREMVNVTKAKQPDYSKMLDELRSAIERRDGFDKSIPRVMVMEEMPKPRETFVLVRGNYEKPEGKVPIAVPPDLAPTPPGAPTNRLGLARWLVSPEHPLTARVTVNRAWQLFFGNGLVKTTEDFGVQGEKPTHPELLDWLATEFIRTGWDVKALQRLIVTSATYRQSSKASTALIERDPENRLLARGARFRLPSWMLRDQALAASGLLVEKVGGPPVKPYQPEGIWEEATFGQIRYTQDHGEALYRRSLYTFWRRIAGPTMFFDVANRQVCAVKSPRTNTPLHALATLNETTHVEAARAMAQRLLAGAEKDEARIESAFRLAAARPPTKAEQRVLAARLAKLRAAFAADPAASAKLLKVGESPRNEKLPAPEHAAWAALCNLILNLDEVITKE